LGNEDKRVFLKGWECLVDLGKRGSGGRVKNRFFCGSAQVGGGRKKGKGGGEKRLCWGRKGNEVGGGPEGWLMVGAGGNLAAKTMNGIKKCRRTTREGRNPKVVAAKRLKCDPGKRGEISKDTGNFAGGGNERSKKGGGKRKKRSSNRL